MATHTLSDEEYGNLVNEREATWKRCGELEAQLAATKAEDPANRIVPLNKLAREMLTVVRFAVANLNPESIRGWPVAALRAIADLIPTMPDYVVDDRDLATELRAFSRDCEDYALQRERMRADKLAADASAPKGDLDRVGGA